ncbi:cation diffusion facilitator family transporter [Methanococcus maripaludis]|uniref:Cation diffusion facilitator family transporter n=1 Tax=Methanococcus maripaludis TaxID=39152 RepID=A0A7J9NKR0_METMI|nr:cation diffusion facilitator family transporter [Methanococcus maripaludis]MBA2841170.1 cation diffusion facilitator family transporter [Methanococcus maripaludis]MBA2853726.1 cation diffusion facilitator family transporter [Methanococcus maripaludis]MBB6402206.1 cation diffusion facilitator family transporter [Methanococcus maripaludis]
MEVSERIIIGNKISKITIVANIGLSILKILAGVFGKSSALIADGMHSFSDILSTVVVMLGLKLSEKPADESHPYGHERIEPALTKILAVILLVTALMIFYCGLTTIIGGNYQIPENITIIAALISIFTKEWMYKYTKKGAEQIESSALLADAWHHRSDAFSSVGTLIGVVGAKLGYPILDPIASIVISLFIAKMAFEIYFKALNQLLDSAADSKTIDEIKKIILSVDGVIEIDVLKTRIHSNKIYVDVEISVNKDLSLIEAHNISENVHSKIESRLKRVKHCMVHVNPYLK